MCQEQKVAEEQRKREEQELQQKRAEEQRKREEQARREQEERERKENENTCSFLYEMYKRCYGAGIGSNTDRCATISANIIVGFRDKLPGDMSTALGLLCGIACSEGSTDKGLPSYSDFKREHCNK